MKPELSERILVKSLFESSMESLKKYFDAGLHIEALAGDASTRRYYRLKNNDKNYVVCMDNPTTKEKKFDFELVQEVLKKNGILVPEIYDVVHDKGFLLEEDLGDNTMLTEISSMKEEEVLQYYKSAIDIIINIQKIKQEERSKIFDRSFDTDKLLSECEMTTEYFLRKYLRSNLTNEEEKSLKKTLHNLCSTLDVPNKVLCHRDLHCRNIMIKEARLYLIDFQDARSGLPFYDLVSLIEDCYFPLQKKARDYLKKYFFEKSEECNIYSENELHKLYAYSSIQRIYKALGSFAYFHETRGDKRYLKYIGVGVQRLKELLKDFPELDSLREILLRSYNES